MTTIHQLTRRFITTGLALFCAATLAAAAFSLPACEQPSTPNNSPGAHQAPPAQTGPTGSGTNQPTEPNTPQPPDNNTAPAPPQDEVHPGSTTKHPDSSAIIYKVYPDENEPEESVELTEFSSECDGIGDIFAENKVAINPTSYDEIIAPLDRVVSLRFNRRGLVGKRITGVGKIDEPVAYRDCPVTLRNPDETITGILVICRNLKGKTVGGEDWSLELDHTISGRFNKIEIVHPD